MLKKILRSTYNRVPGFLNTSSIRIRAKKRFILLVEKLAYQLGEQNCCDYGTNLAFSLVRIVYCLYYYYVTQLHTQNNYENFIISLDRN